MKAITIILALGMIGVSSPAQEPVTNRLIDYNGFQKIVEDRGKGFLKEQLHAASDHDAAIELLRKLQKRQQFPESGDDSHSG